jgi:pentalenic acid synthase
VASIASANRDETIFHCPDDFDISRENSHKHLAFGAGIHYCAGSALGRVELEVALRTLVTRLPDMKLKTDFADLKWLTEHTMRGVYELPVVW